MARKNLFKFIGDLTKKAKTDDKDYGTGLVGEGLIIASYEMMPLPKLEKLRFILNKIIKQKKEMKRVRQRTQMETDGQKVKEDGKNT